MDAARRAVDDARDVVTSSPQAKATDYPIILSYSWKEAVDLAMSTCT
jgi:hypothetical protein